MIGVNGWYSANQRSPAGIESVGTKALLRNGSMISEHRQCCWPSRRSWLTRPERDRQPGEGEGDQREQRRPPRATRAGRPSGRKPRAGDGDDDDDAGDRSGCRLPSTWPVEHGGAGDRHRAEAGDDALGHVGGDRDRGARARRRRRSSAGCPARGSRGSRRGRRRRAAEAGAERAAEDVDEQQQEHDRHAASRSASATGSAGCAGGCGAASSPSR